MSLYLKRWVSGKKARFRDDKLDLELDLAYVTDRIIVMGFPAVGVESIYRNNRADVQRFLSTRHGSDFWVFNFCPLRENAYHGSVFDDRVSRYPFPDHHVPPFLYLPLVTREMHTWLSGSDTRVAVLHCKAGKGRSGALACAYLLALYTSPPTPIPRSLHESFSDWSLIGEQETLPTTLSNLSAVSAVTNDGPPTRPASVPSSADFPQASSAPVVNTLEKVLDFHTSRRMKNPPALSRHHSDIPLAKKSKMGVSIPSQRRWLFYWSQILGGKGPPSFWLFPWKGHPRVREMPFSNTSQIGRVKLIKLTIRMRELSGLQPRLVQVASAVITSAGMSRKAGELPRGRLWASLARYSDQLVDELDHWEKQTRSSVDVTGTTPFKSDHWDMVKMIRSFAKMVTSDVPPRPGGDSRRPVFSYVLRPPNGAEGDWVNLPPCPSSKSASGAPVSPQPEEGNVEEPGILLEANREFRIKLFVGEVTLGWVWLIPAFHVSPESPSSTFVLYNGDIDFATGMGKALVDMKVSFSCHPCRQSF